MEMLYTIMAGVGVGVLAAHGKNDYEKIVSLCFAGAAAIAAALVYTMLSGETVGTSGSIVWPILGVVGGVAGVIFQRVLMFVLNRIVAMIQASHEGEPHETPHQV